MDREEKKMLEEILTAIKCLDGRVSKLEVSAVPAGSSAGDGSASPEKKLSLREFIIDRAPSNAVQTTLTIAYYLEIFDGVAPFNAADLEQGFRAARESVPPNINDKANMCVGKGYFMVDKNKKDNMKAWLVTRTGLQAVDKGFGKTQS